MSTYFPSGKVLAGRRKWYVVDASGQTVGHLASEVASILTGKRSPQWTPFLDTGDHVVVVNAAHVKLTGNKEKQKLYRRHSGYPGGLRAVSYVELLDKNKSDDASGDSSSRDCRSCSGSSCSADRFATWRSWFLRWVSMVSWRGSRV